MTTTTRRAFLGRGAALAAGTLLARRAFSTSAAADPNRFALLSDLHIAADAAATPRDVNVFARLATALEQVLRQDPLPCALIVCGDLALDLGTAGDYAQLQRLLQPARGRGLGVHLALGNHDRREPFAAAFGAPGGSPPAGRHAFVVESPFVNWFVLDSLEPGSVSGRLGDVQLKWLAEGVDARGPKPAFILLHHPPDLNPNGSGLADTAALLELLKPRPQVKALFFGHTHAWSAGQRQGIWGINVPSVAYTFDAAQPAGWLDVRVGADAAELVVQCHDAAHPKHGERVTIPLRPPAA